MSGVTHYHIRMLIFSMMVFLFQGAARAAQAPPQCPADLRVGPERALAYPIVTGSVGSLKAAHITLISTTALAGPFTGRLDTADGHCVVLRGPDDTTGLFDFFVKKVLLLPIDHTTTKAIVILYDMTHRSPNVDSVSAALVYSVRANGAVRLTRLEDRLAAAHSAKDIKRKLQGAHR